MNSRTLYLLSLIGLLLGGLTASLAAPHNTLLDVRVGPHKSFDRVVFEFQAEVAGRAVVKGDQKLEIRFSGVNVSRGFSLPPLPPGLSVVKRMDAYKEGENAIVFVVFLAKDATPTELPLVGQPWRLAVDLAPRVTESPGSKPEYIPGDQPIPTTLADVAPTESPADTLDAARVHSVLAFYYWTEGESARALEEASIYKSLTGTELNLTPDAQPKQAPKITEPKPPRDFKSPRMFFPGDMPTLTLILGAFGVGLGAGFLLKSLLSRSRAPRAPKPPKPPKQKKTKTKPVVEVLSRELEGDLQQLDAAINQEPLRQMAPPPPPPEPEPVLDEVPAAENEMRESLMDRRVRRVLELNKQGASISSIAEELQMGQDEVKLILDLNQ